MALPHLFSPIKLGKVEIANRTAMSPMGVGLYSSDETWPRRELRYFEERAIGGIGLLITPFVRVHKTLASIPLAGIYEDRLIPTHRELTERIHQYDTKVFLQIALSGGKLSTDAPSSIYSPNYVVKPRALTTDEVDELVQSFIDAAGRGIEAGYDGVEVHGAHSYLIGQMMSPAMNKRTDKYGGSFEARMKFATDIITGIMEKHPGLPVGFKLSAHEEIPGGVDIGLAKKIARHIADLGIVYIHVASTASTIEVLSDYPSVPPLYIPRNTLIPLAEAIKKAVPDTTVIGTGSITVPEEAEGFIADGKCDMVALGRTILADPHWANNAKQGKRVVPCIRCNVCYHQLWLAGPLWCSVNPYLLHESEQDLPTPGKKKKVMIAGAGPAGIRCALTASKRGHDVTLYEKESVVGGMVYPGSRPKCKEDVARLYDWYVAELKDSGVTLRLNTEVTPDLVDNEKPDALVIAMGAKQIVPDLPGIEKSHVATAVDVLRDVKKYQGKDAVVVGGGDVGCETACLLADNGWNVTIVEMLPNLLEENIMTNVKVHMFRLLDEKNVCVMTGTKLSAVTDEGVEVVLPSGKAWGLDADLAVIAMGFQEPATFTAGGSAGMNITAQSGLAGELAMKADEVYVIGDCATLGRIREATEAGERVGRWL
ncbi:MAG: FAD-dependent oxidoreductase [Candidatus Latescibacteria bacterium]|nr:FAD-dependent oxidoreductase [Candidatus Latescibacterota bacterium]